MTNACLNRLVPHRSSHLSRCKCHLYWSNQVSFIFPDRSQDFSHRRLIIHSQHLAYCMFEDYCISGSILCSICCTIKYNTTQTNPPYAYCPLPGIDGLEIKHTANLTTTFLFHHTSIPSPCQRKKKVTLFLILQEASSISFCIHAENSCANTSLK